jgi:hypothetical protein
MTLLAIFFSAAKIEPARRRAATRVVEDLRIGIPGGKRVS